MTRILREREVRNITGLSRVTRWRLEKRGEFPRRIHITERSIGWLESEVMDWLQARAKARGRHLTVPIQSDEKGGVE